MNASNRWTWESNIRQEDGWLTKYERIRRFLDDRGYPKFRLKQITDAVFKNRIGDFERMTVLPKPLRNQLCEQFGSSILGIRPLIQSASVQAKKILFEVSGGHKTEAVAMTYKAGWESFCISSQSGCGFGCQFCATGAVGLKKNLSADEITDQVLYFHLQQHSIDSVSFMGMGEALANPQTFAAIRTLTDPGLFGLSPRRLTISTIGIIPGIVQLTRQFPQINLTFSLHTPFDDQRSELMPINRKYPIPDVMSVLDEYIREAGRKVYIAYVLLPGVNDSTEHAKAVIALLKGRGPWARLYHVNLIRYNPAAGAPGNFERPERRSVEAFYRQLRTAGLNVTIRPSFGMDIDAACGQLYGQYRIRGEPDSHSNSY